MASEREKLVTRAGNYLRQVATARLEPAGDIRHDEQAWKAEDDLWVGLVRARNAFLAAKDEKEMSR